MRKKAVKPPSPEPHRLAGVIDSMKFLIIVLRDHPDQAGRLIEEWNGHGGAFTQDAMAHLTGYLIINFPELMEEAKYRLVP